MALVVDAPAPYGCRGTGICRLIVLLCDWPCLSTFVMRNADRLVTNRISPRARTRGAALETNSPDSRRGTRRAEQGGFDRSKRFHRCSSHYRNNPPAHYHCNSVTEPVASLQKK